MIARRPPTGNPDSLSAWYDSLAESWVAFAESAGVSAIDYSEMGAGGDTPALRREDTDAAMVNLVDARLFVSRLVDRARVYAGELAFRAWIMRRATSETRWTDLAQALSVSPVTAPRLVARFDASILDMYRGDTVDAFLVAGETWAWVPNTDHKYIVTNLGAVFSIKRGAVEPMTVSSAGRVHLHVKGGRRYRPSVSVLIERCFGAQARYDYETER